MTEKLGTTWAVLDSYHKIYSCCQHAHSTVEAVISLAADQDAGTRAADITELLIETHALALDLDNIERETTLAARFSVPHAAAATLLVGNAGPDAFTTKTLTDPDIAALREKVRLQPFSSHRPTPNDRPSRVTVVYGDGERATAECLSARGGPDRPFTDAEILRKAADLTEGLFPRFGDTAARVAACDAALMSHSWEKIVADLVSR